MKRKVDEEEGSQQAVGHLKKKIAVEKTLVRNLKIIRIFRPTDQSILGSITVMPSPCGEHDQSRNIGQ